mgnify:FL=1|jgi:translation elongation factor EF-G
MNDFDIFEALDNQITEYRLTPQEAANHLEVSEELIDIAIEAGEFDDILKYKDTNYIHMDDIKDFVLRGCVEKMNKQMEGRNNE